MLNKPVNNMSMFDTLVNSTSMSIFDTIVNMYTMAAQFVINWLNNVWSRLWYMMFGFLQNKLHLDDTRR